MGHSSYKLKAVGMAQTEILRIKKWFVFTDKILAEPQVPDTGPSPPIHLPCTGGPSLEFHLGARIWLPTVGIWDTWDKAQTLAQLFPWAPPPQACIKVVCADRVSGSDVPLSPQVSRGRIQVLSGNVHPWPILIPAPPLTSVLPGS